MNLMRFDPFLELEEVSNRLNRIFGREMRVATRPETAFADWAPAMDVEESDTEYLIKADLPDVKREDVKVSVEDGILALEGERRMEKDEEGRKYHRVERSYGKFVRRMTVPTNVDQQKVAAEFKDGVLNVHLPKAPVSKPKAVDVKVA
ncbi:MAG TPA: Hsp20/alpha crystallin family protein [Vicinamibacterales bacterium]|nr:Hsp20/alpha crystallin family protein [Vicinamibacterales bacterium]